MIDEYPDQKFLVEEYKSRINRVMDYIDKNIDKKFSLIELAKVANFSKFHFHRIFYSFLGETLFQFIGRLRIEKAAFLLLTRPKKSITEIAMDCGFADSASFARSFKEHFNMSASLWRQTKSHDQSNISKIKSKNCQLLGNQRKEISASSTYIDYRNNSQVWMINMVHRSRTVEVKDLAEMTVAYVRHIGPYESNARLFERLYNKLFKWAGPRNLINFPSFGIRAGLELGLWHMASKKRICT